MPPDTPSSGTDAIGCGGGTTSLGRQYAQAGLAVATTCPLPVSTQLRVMGSLRSSIALQHSTSAPGPDDERFAMAEWVRMKTDDTIAAIATPAGRGGLGVVRLSGPGAHQIAGQVLGRPFDGAN